MTTTLVYGGKVWTGNTGAPYAEAFLVQKGVFKAVGTKAYVESKLVQGEDVERIDAKGALVIPGITDAHLHLTAYCKQGLYLDLSSANSLEELLAAIGSHVEKSGNSRWLRVMNFNESNWAVPVLPTMEQIDAVSGGKPVLVSRYCGHVHVANRKAMIDAGLWETRSEYIVRDENGTPTGVLHESGAGPILDRVVAEHETPEKIRALSLESCKKLASMGITAVHACDAPLYGLPEQLSIFQDLYDQGTLPLRVISYFDKMPNYDFRTGFGNAFVNFAGFKIFIDGGLGGRGATMREDFSDAPGVRGTFNHTDEALYDMIRAATERDIQIQIHMIGDSAIDQAIRACKKVVADLGKKPRYPFRFNHLIVSPPDQIDGLKELGVVVDIQPIQAHTDRNMAPARIGSARMQHIYSFRRLYDSGLLLTGSSDGPMENPNPWIGVWVAVCRTDYGGTPLKDAKMDEVLTLDEALTIYTKNPYRAIGWSGYGTISEGAHADFAILENDPFTEDKQKLKDIKVRATYLEGVKTF